MTNERRAAIRTAKFVLCIVAVIAAIYILPTDLLAILFLVVLAIAATLLMYYWILDDIQAETREGREDP